jgi:carbamoyl-phosphate synthase large subunit
MIVTTRGYKDLIVWQKSMKLTNSIYDLTESFPRDQQYRLVDQMQRSAVSIPSNIAEGSKRGGKAEFRHFLRIAYASGAELETQIEIAILRTYGEPALLSSTKSLLDEVMRMLHKMIGSLK